MIVRSGEDRPVLGDPPDPPAGIWGRAMAHVLDPWAVPAPGLVPTDRPPEVAADDDGSSPMDGEPEDPGGRDDPREVEHDRDAPPAHDEEDDVDSHT